SPSLTLTGYVVTGRKYVDLGAAVPGRVDWIGVEEGDRFEAGQPLARLEQDELRAQRQFAAAALEAAEARLSELVSGPLPEELAREGPGRRGGGHPATGRADAGPGRGAGSRRDRLSLPARRRAQRRDRGPGALADGRRGL